MLNLNFIDFPRLYTERLILKKVLKKDYNFIHKLHSDPIVNAFVGRENTTTLEQAREYIERISGMVKKKECLYWAITLSNNDALIGSACCWNFDHESDIVEIGYEMLPEFQGKGYMKEALQAVLKFTFNNLKAKVITAFPSSDNINSVAILKKLNFVFENQNYNNKHVNIENIVTYTLRP
jgi:ribosomal-protein-alanine N-acetyltransferase